MVDADPNLASLLKEDPSLVMSADAYSCMVAEYGEFSLHEFMSINKNMLDNIARQAIMHQLIKGTNMLHSRGAFLSDFTWIQSVTY